MWRLAILAFCVALGSTQTAEKGNLDDLIDDVFAKSPAQPQDIPNEKPCNGGKGECVPYYLVRYFISFLSFHSPVTHFTFYFIVR